MGKIILAGVLALALFSSAYSGALGGNSTVQKLESGYEQNLIQIQNGFHSNCPESSDYDTKVNNLSGRRHAAMLAYKIYTSNYSTCGNGEGGY